MESSSARDQVYPAMFPRYLLPCSLVLLASCSSSSTSAPQAEEPGTDASVASDAASEQHEAQPPDPAALGSTQTTTVITYTPSHALESASGPNPSLPENLAPYLDQGYGDRSKKPGEAYTTITADGGAPPAPGPNARRVARFVHLSDLQLPDDESPTRMGTLDTTGATNGALRPQDGELCRMANAAVRTINALHRADPFDLVLMGGDNIDNAQTNELHWLFGILNGGTVECDSGNDDDPVPGKGNDGKDPFVSEGLLVPWKWVSGNHDILVQGNFPVEEYYQDAVSDWASVGTRDYSQGGKVVTGAVVPDPQRIPLNRVNMMTAVAGDSDGHGLGSSQAASGRAFYTYDLPGTPVRFVVLDTAAEKGGAEGILHRADVDSFVRPAFDKAKTEGKWVIFASHHGFTSLTSDGGSFGVTASDAVLGDEWAKFVGGYNNVIFSLAGHAHEHRLRHIVPQTGNAWWEIMTGAIADFPFEFRVLEIFDEDNGLLKIRATCVDLDTSGDAVAARGVMLGTVDLTSGWLTLDGRGKGPEVRNIDVWVTRPGN